jgi:hypothetical protein
MKLTPDEIIPDWRKRTEDTLRRRLDLPRAAANEKILTPKEVMQMISDMAQFGDGVDRKWALNVMRSASAEQAAIPVPLNEREVILRIARILRGYGEIVARNSFLAAFPKTIALRESKIKLPSDADPDPDHLPETLDDLWARWPSKRPIGLPKGYPYRAKHTEEDRINWIKRRALEFIQEDEKRARKAARDFKLELEAGKELLVEEDKGTDAPEPNLLG